jgi:hypothetical protein
MWSWIKKGSKKSLARWSYMRPLALQHCRQPDVQNVTGGRECKVVPKEQPACLASRSMLVVHSRCPKSCSWIWTKVGMRAGKESCAVISKKMQNRIQSR